MSRRRDGNPLLKAITMLFSRLIPQRAHGHAARRMVRVLAVAGVLQFMAYGFVSDTVVLAQSSSDNQGVDDGAADQREDEYQAVRALCLESIRDAAQPQNCLRASSTPTLGLLFPLTEAFNVTPEGKVGIGTTAPTAALQVVDNRPVSSFLGVHDEGMRVQGTDVTNTYSLFGFDHGGHGRNLSQIGSYFTGGGTYLTFGTSADYDTGITNQALTIDPFGHVGIGQPEWCALSVVGGNAGGPLSIFRQTHEAGFGLSITPGSNSLYALRISDAGNNADRHIFMGDGRAFLGIDGGNVGVGTTTPTETLDVNGTVYGHSEDRTGVWGESANAEGVYGQSTGGNGVFGLSGSGYGVRGHSDVIGVYGYSQTVDGVGVRGDHNISGNHGRLGTSSEGVYGQSTSGNGVFGLSVSGYGVRGHSDAIGVYGYSSSNDGIGVRGDHNISGNHGRLGTASAGVVGHGGNGPAGYFDGNVGIGTATPQATLDVSGTVRSTGFQLTTAPQAGHVLTSDADGLATWQPPPQPPGIPTGVIVMWSGALSSIPSGWALCDGTNGTPDLRDRFILGVSDRENPGGVGGSNSHAHSIGSHAHTVDPPQLQMPNHTHRIPEVRLVNTAQHAWYDRVAVTGGSSYASSTSHTHGINIPSTQTTDTGVAYIDIGLFQTGISGAGATSGASHIPPYYKLAFIMKQ